VTEAKSRNELTKCMESDIRSWEDFIEWQPTFPKVMHKWLRLMRLLALKTLPEETNRVGQLIVGPPDSEPPGLGYGSAKGDDW
jgi:hypothetical protein